MKNKEKETKTIAINVTMEVPAGQHCATDSKSCAQKRGAHCIAFNSDLPWDKDFSHVKKCPACLTLSGNK